MLYILLIAFAYEKRHVTQTMNFIFHIIENTVEKGENAGYQHFLFFPQSFQEVSNSL